MTSISTAVRFLEDGTALPVPVPTELLAQPVSGTRLASSPSLGDQLGPRPDALVFLRHFG